MAEIKIIGNIETTRIFNRFKPEDLALVSVRNKKNNFGLKEDYIEYFIYDVGENLLNINYNYTDFKSSPNVGLDENGNITYIEIDPVKDVQSYGYSTGELVTQYNFFRQKISNFFEEGLFIKEISPDRTEIRVISNILSNEQIEENVLKLIEEINTVDYFKTYLINFGVNQQYVIVNIALNKEAESYEILLKLYEPLPEFINEKRTFWLVDEIIEPYIFNINLDILIISDPLPFLKGPNFNIELPDKNTITTTYQNYNDLIKETSGSTYQQFLSYVTSKSIDINVDYTDLSNFNKFGSVEKRLNIFYNKVEDIQTYQSQIDLYETKVSTTSSLRLEINNLSSNINNIISNFDGFEYYLYFESSSLTSSLENYITPYPKSGSLKPFVLYPYNHSSSSLWYSSSLSKAQNYDKDNYNRLTDTIPLYIKEDSNNENYINFIDMIGHYFDNIWIYLKSVTDLYKSYNNLEKGISKDLVFYALNSLGFKTYNSKENTELLDYIIGNNTGSINFSNDFSSTSSYLNNIPKQDLVSETYKRIYHNISLLFKSKGSKQNIDYLSNIFGITSSILELKEYGGITKNQYLKGYNTDKIRIVNNTITGSLLSPFIGLEQKTTSSNDFISIDLHKVDIGFSPQNQIDNLISSSLTSSFNIDNYIGDPTYAYSSSYESLNLIKQSTFSNVFDYQFDYSGFIRLIKFFDNTLFKTFKDFSPIRNNTSTGIIFRSPQIERNKIKQLYPNISYNVVQEASYSIGNISEDKSYIWSLLSGSRESFYNGEFPTEINSVNYYFENTNPNPYLLSSNTVTLNAKTGSNIFPFNNSYIFEHTDFNVLLNNVSSSRLSINRNKLEPIYVANSSIRLSGFISSSKAELQDSYLTLQSYNLSRYEGSKTKSLLYNNYTSASTDYEGDKSFGKTAAIDKHVKKIGIFAQIVESIYLPNRNMVRLKYLIDKEGSLTELNQRNNNWCEIQRTFVAGDVLDVSLFDNQKYGNQKLTDGIKPIFDSGYAYYPILYFSSCSVDPSLSFENLNLSNAGLAKAYNSLTPSAYLSGSSPLGYPIVSGSIKSIFNIVTQGQDYFTAGTSSNYPTYIAQDGGNFKANATFTLNVTMPSGGYSTWSLAFYKSSSTGETLLAKETAILDIVSSINTVAYDDNFYKTFCTNDINKFVNYSLSQTSTVPITLGSTTYPAGTTFYGFNFEQIGGLLSTPSCSYSGSGYLWGINPIIEMEAVAGCAGCGPTYTYRVFGPKNPITLYRIDAFSSNVRDASYTFNLTEDPISLESSEKIITKFIVEGTSTSNFTASINTGDLTISSTSAATGYSLTFCPYFDSASLSASISNTASLEDDVIIFSTGLSNIHNKNFIFVPNPLSGSQNSLYDIYGDVDYEYKIKPFDIVLTYLSDNTYVESRVLQVWKPSGSLLYLKLDKALSPLYRNDLISGSYKRFLLLTRLEDETNAYITYRKRPSPTSYGFAIPSNIHPEVMANIDIITEEAKKKLIELGGIDGGVI